MAAANEIASTAMRADETGAEGVVGFRFIPRELACKCRQLIESYHAIYGYVGLADMLWLSEARELIERHRELARMFSKASKSRSVKHANQTLVTIATTIVSIEVLARDFSGWGKRFPKAQREAERQLDGAPHSSRAWLIDLYLFPPLGVRRELTDVLALPASADSTSVREKGDAK